MDSEGPAEHSQRLATLRERRHRWKRMDSDIEVTVNSQRLAALRERRHRWKRMDSDIEVTVNSERLAALRERRHRWKRMDSDIEVTTPCHFYAIGKGCNTLLMSNFLQSKLCHPSFMCRALSSSVLDYAYVCALSGRGLLCACVHLVTTIITLQKKICCFHHRVVTLVAVKLKRQWL